MLRRCVVVDHSVLLSSMTLSQGQGQFVHPHLFGILPYLRLLSLYVDLVIDQVGDRL